MSAVDLTTLSRELATTRAALADTVAKVRNRNRLSAAVSVLSIVAFAVYLGYAYHRYANEVTPDLVAASASSSFQDQLPAVRTQLEQSLKDSAPKVVNDMFAQMKAMPDKYATQLQGDAVAKLDASMPQVQDQMYQAMKQALDKSVAANAAAGTGPNDEEKMRTTLAAVGDVYAADTMKFVDQTHGTYAADAATFTDYLDRLATSPNLDRRDRLHREMFRTVFALVRERAANPRAGDGAVDLTNLKGKS